MSVSNMVLSLFERTMLSMGDTSSGRPTDFCNQFGSLVSKDDNGNLPLICEKGPGVFMEAFLHNNRLEQVSGVMGYHPDYLRNFLQAQNFLLREDGPLSYEYRHYIAIMAASRHHCSYLVKLHEQDFLLHNGNPDWLQGISHLPRKLQDLYEVNKVLAHRPWLLTRAHITGLLKASPEPWSLSELMHAVILLTHFHALCSFVYGTGISQDLSHPPSSLEHPPQQQQIQQNNPPPPPHLLAATTDNNSSPKIESGGRGVGGGLSPTDNTTVVSPGNHLAKPYDCCKQLGSPRSPSPTANGGGGGGGGGGDTVGGETKSESVASLMAKMRRLTEVPPSAEATSPEELLKRFHSVECQSAQISAPSIGSVPHKAETLRYVSDPDFAYVDFASRSAQSEVATFRACDYSWEDHGFSLANRLYLDVGHLLDDKFSLAQNLTYYTMGDNREVDTSSFRRAIWNYVHCLYGIRHDDYDYSEVNQLLERGLKAYIKTLTCYPERLTRQDHAGVMLEFKHSEKVHVNLMVMEARQQAELLYALRSLNRYMT